MTDKIKISIAAVSLALAFATGRYSVSPPTVKVDQKTQTQGSTQTHQDEHKKTVIVQIPNGATTTTITDDMTVSQQQQDASKTDTQTSSIPSTRVLNLSALAGIQPTNSLAPVYGVAITKQVLGPVTIGAFGFTNSLVGLSVGINF